MSKCDYWSDCDYKAKDHSWINFRKNQIQSWVTHFFKNNKKWGLSYSILIKNQSIFSWNPSHSQIVTFFRAKGVWLLWVETVFWTFFLSMKSWDPSLIFRENYKSNIYFQNPSPTKPAAYAVAYAFYCSWTIDSIFLGFAALTQLFYQANLFFVC